MRKDVEVVKLVVNITRKENEELENCFSDVVAICNFPKRMKEAIMARTGCIEVADDLAKAVDTANAEFTNGLMDYASQLDAYAIVVDSPNFAKELVITLGQRNETEPRVFLLQENKLLCEGDIRYLFYDDFFMKDCQFENLEEALKYLDAAEKYVGLSKEFDQVLSDYRSIKEDIVALDQAQFFVKVMSQTLEGKVPEYYQRGFKGIFKAHKHLMFSAITSFFDVSMGIEGQYKVYFVPEKDRKKMQNAVKTHHVGVITGMMKAAGAALVVTDNKDMAAMLTIVLGKEHVFFYDEGVVVRMDGRNISHTSLIMSLLHGNE